MVSEVVWEILVIVCLILLNGFFAGAELAIIAARRGRLKQLAAEGDRGARLALELAANPNRFLPTVQVGITLVGTFAAAFGGARLVQYLADVLSRAPIDLVVRNREPIALTVVVLGITFLSVLFGELVPKRLAVRSAATVARVVARPMHLLAVVGRPAVWLMAAATDAILALFRIRGTKEPNVSLEDIEHLLELGTIDGILAPVEHRVALEALRLGERTVKQIMRPRIDIDAVDVNTPPAEVLGTLAMAGFSRLPVYEGDLDHIIGFVHLKDVVRNQYLGWRIDVRKLLRPALFVPETLPVDRLLVLFQERGNQLAIVLDEFGGTEGMVTLEDVMEELVGEIRDETRHEAKHDIVQRDESSWLVDGSVSITDLMKRLDLREPDAATPRRYSTVAGLVLAQMGRLPSVGDRTTWENLELEVVDMDGRRIDRVLVSRSGSAIPSTTQ